MNEKHTIVIAEPEDIPELERLVNSAYRGEVSKQGWTTEADLLDGIRVDENSLRDMMQHEHAVILKYLNPENRITGCVYLEQQGHRMYLGMLSVKPLQQSSGIGTSLLKAAECYALQKNCTVLGITVITVRKELIAWYLRWGFCDTGIRKPFPADAHGTATQPLEFMVMEKTLTAR